MRKTKIAVDMGTSFTSIYESGNGIVLHEPSVIAYYDNDNKRKVRAVGSEAYAMIGKLPENTKIVFPIIDGVIRDVDACADMLGAYISRIMPESFVIKPKYDCVLSVPMSLSVEEYEVYEEVLSLAGIDDISMVNTLMLSALGTDLSVTSDFGGIVLNIGGGSSCIGAVGLCGIITGYTISVGGDMIDSAIMDRVSGCRGLHIGRTQARKLKESIASLIFNDRAQTRVSGIDLDTRTVDSRLISADDIYCVVSDYYGWIARETEKVINTCTPAVAAEIAGRGITIVGGGAKIPGLTEVMTKQLNLRVRVPQDAKYATILGGGKLLSDSDLLDAILYHS